MDDKIDGYEHVKPDKHTYNIFLMSKHSIHIFSAGGEFSFIE